ncbi:MAG: PHP domain-containing protein [Clostridia bacterium]|nr:PHP domain-containing protein [Clostridia bacterium]
MILTADYHTHTPFSHGKNTVLENAEKAKEQGLQQIAITDHGYTHVVFGLRRRKIKEYRAQCEEATRKTGVKVLVGIEANVLGVEGHSDLKETDFEDFDVYLCGTHLCVWYKPFISQFFSFFARNYSTEKLHLKHSDKLIQNNTLAYCNTIKNNPIDALTHVNYLCKCNSLEVAKVASDYGTYIELNSKKTHFTDEELMDMALKTSVRFLINSDAHSASRVGEIERVKEQLGRINFPLDRIDNIDGRLPNFRFKEFKQRL